MLCLVFETVLIVSEWSGAVLLIAGEQFRETMNCLYIFLDLTDLLILFGPIYKWLVNNLLMRVVLLMRAELLSCDVVVEAVADGAVFNRSLWH
jgi:hypothetical protein